MEMQRLERLAWEGDREAEKAIQGEYARRNLPVPVWVRADTSPKSGCIVVDLPPHPHIRIHLLPNKNDRSAYHILLIAHKDCIIEWEESILWTSHLPHRYGVGESYPVTYWWQESHQDSPIPSGIIAHMSGM